jgi:hypothetical protein
MRNAQLGRLATRSAANAASAPLTRIVTESPSSNVIEQPLTASSVFAIATAAKACARHLAYASAGLILAMQGGTSKERSYVF